MKYSWFTDINWKRLDAGKEPPLFVPDPDCVYAKDLFDIRRFSKISGVKITESDDLLYKKFNTGAVSSSWQEEMMETGVFNELNFFGPGGKSRSCDLDFDLEPEEEPIVCNLTNCFQYFGCLNLNKSKEVKVPCNDIRIDEIKSINEEPQTNQNIRKDSKSPTVPIQKLESFCHELERTKTVKAVSRVCSNLSNIKGHTKAKHVSKSISLDHRSSDCSSTKTDYLNSTRLITSPQT